MHKRKLPTDDFDFLIFVSNLQINFEFSVNQLNKEQRLGICSVRFRIFEILLPLLQQRVLHRRAFAFEQLHPDTLCHELRKELAIARLQIRQTLLIGMMQIHFNHNSQFVLHQSQLRSQDIGQANNHVLMHQQHALQFSRAVGVGNSQQLMR